MTLEHFVRDFYQATADQIPALSDSVYGDRLIVDTTNDFVSLVCGPIVVSTRDRENTSAQVYSRAMKGDQKIVYPMLWKYIKAYAPGHTVLTDGELMWNSRLEYFIENRRRQELMELYKGQSLRSLQHRYEAISEGVSSLSNMLSGMDHNTPQYDFFMKKLVDAKEDMHDLNKVLSNYEEIEGRARPSRSGMARGYEEMVSDIRQRTSRPEPTIQDIRRLAEEAGFIDNNYAQRIMNDSGVDLSESEVADQLRRRSRELATEAPAFYDIPDPTDTATTFNVSYSSTQDENEEEDLEWTSPTF